MKKFRYSILTYIIGKDYEKLHEIQKPTDDVEYILVTDNKELKSNTWKIVYDDSLDGYSTWEKCYRIRFNPFKYCTSDICLRIDGSIEVLQNPDPLIDEFINNNYDIGLMPHPERYDIMSELYMWNNFRNYPAECVKNQIDFLNKMKYDTSYKGLFQLNIQLMKKSKFTDDINNLAFYSLKCIGLKTSIERLDQTIYSALLNTFFDHKKILPISDASVVDSKYFRWYWHGTNRLVRPCYKYNLRYIFNELCKVYHLPDSIKIKSALVTIAKDEDKYIDEWIEYNLNIGFDKIFIYQNDWRYTGKYLNNDKIKFIECDGIGRQIYAYNNFIENYHTQFDFAAFFDVDEFIYLKNGVTINKFLESYLDFASIYVSWRYFGDNGLTDVIDNNYSITRFTKCAKHLSSFGKHILNLNIVTNKYKFINPHHVASLDSSEIIAVNTGVTLSTKNGRIHYENEENKKHENVEVAELYHYRTKTFAEYYDRKFNKQSVFWGKSTPSYRFNADEFRADYDEYNLNEIENFNLNEIINQNESNESNESNENDKK